MSSTNVLQCGILTLTLGTWSLKLCTLLVSERRQPFLCHSSIGEIGDYENLNDFKLTAVVQNRTGQTGEA